MNEDLTVALVQLWPRYLHHFASQLANHLADHCKVVVFTGLDRPQRLYRSCVRKVTLPIRIPPKYKTGHFLHFAAGFRISSRFIREIQSVRPDLIHIVFTHPYALVAALTLKRHIPVLVERHDARAHPGEGSFLRSKYESLELSIPDGFIVHSKAVRLRLEGMMNEKRKPISKPIWEIPLGDLSSLRIQPFQPEPTDRRPQILFFGRIYRYKGLDILLEAAVRVLSQIPSVRFVIAGEGDWKPYFGLLAKIPKRNITIHRGFIRDELVAELFCRSNLVVLPYREASQSGILPVAAAFGRAVVATSVGGIPEYIQDGINGVLVEPENPAQLAQRMVELVGNATLRRRYADALSRDYAGRFSFDKLRWAYLRTYRSLLAERAASVQGRPMKR